MTTAKRGVKVFDAPKRSIFLTKRWPMLAVGAAVSAVSALFYFNVF